MANAKSIRRKLTKKVIGKLGFDTIFMRLNSVPGSGFDDYGEPISQDQWDISSGAIRITIDQDKRAMYSTDGGGNHDPKKEYIDFYCSGDFDIRTGDKIVYPPNSDSEWIVDKVEPFMMNDVSVITECRACRDAKV